VQPLGLDDVMGRDRYGSERDHIRRRIIAHKRVRRVGIGDRVTFLFEDRATVWYQTQEMLWVEHITDLDAIRDELTVYGALLPGPSELSATMLIEIADPARVRGELERLLGIDRCVALEVGRERVPGVFEEGRQTDFKLSAVQYVRFPVHAAARERLAGGEPLALVIDHPHYAHRVRLSDATRASLASDILDPAVANEGLTRVRDG